MSNLLYLLVLLPLITGFKAHRAKSTLTVVALQPAQARIDRWTYEKTTDASGVTVYKASLQSPTVLEFAYPYSGGSIATLTLRHKEGSTHAYIEVSKGHFNRSFQAGTALIRFDNQAPVRYSLSAAANGRANIIFLDVDRRLIDRMKQARKMSVDVAFEGQGKRQMEFNTAGLVWNH